MKEIQFEICLYLLWGDEGGISCAFRTVIRIDLLKSLRFVFSMLNYDSFATEFFSARIFV